MEQHAADSLTGCLSDCLSNPESEHRAVVVDTISSCLDGFALGASASFHLDISQSCNLSTVYYSTKSDHNDKNHAYASM